MGRGWFAFLKFLFRNLVTFSKLEAAETFSQMTASGKRKK